MISSRCGRFFHWPDSCLADHIEQAMYGDRSRGAAIVIDAPAARFIRGKVLFNGGTWIHPKYRRPGIASLAAKVGRLFRSEERRVGKECGSTCRSRGSRLNSKKKK